MLAGNRPLLLLDEPTYAQDERATQFIMELLRHRIDQGLTAVIATHDLALARCFATGSICWRTAACSCSDRNSWINSQERSHASCAL